MIEIAKHGEGAFASDTAQDDMLVLVDLLDRQIGSVTKMEAHVKGLLHRAFSVVLWREGASGVEFLLTRRAQGKYHSSGLWANSCCSHPRAGEKLEDAVRRRVREELGCEIDGTRELGSFVYRAVFCNGIIEYEYDHVFAVEYDGEPSPDPAESDASCWVGTDELIAEICERPHHFSAWTPGVFSIALRELARR